LNNYIFKSARLGFRNWTEPDVPKMIKISGDPEVMEFFPAPATPAQTSDFIHRMKQEFEEKGYCYFAVDLLETGELIGFTGLLAQNYEAPFTPCVDIGWRLSPKYWYNGYATEGAKRCLEYAFFELQLKRIVATAPKINQRSIAVMEKIGMHWKLDFRHPRLKDHPHLEECVCYEMQAPNVP
jgi:RimJ/RimL family protein N-acetyltransferase